MPLRRVRASFGRARTLADPVAATARVTVGIDDTGQIVLTEAVTNVPTVHVGLDTVSLSVEAADAHGEVDAERNAVAVGTVVVGGAPVTIWAATASVSTAVSVSLSSVAVTIRTGDADIFIA